MVRKRATYFYDEEVGNYHYGAGHPMKPHRVRMTHDLIQTYGLIDRLSILVPERPLIDSLTRFHANDYIDFLRFVNTENMSDYGDQMCRFNVGEDCPVFDGLWEFCNIYAGGSIGGAQKVMKDNYDLAFNWAGGLHHGKKHEASGFCYINDCVLAALEFLKYQHRVLYVDIDIHHGDGVEEAFYTTPRVMCVSFHKYGDYFPGTGALNDIGVDEGLGYSVNVPLRDGLDDETFIFLYKNVMELVMSNYKPEAIVLQCGADSLSGDRLGCFNLSLKGHGYAMEWLSSYDIPMLVLGGGGYTLRNVPKCWAHETATLLGLQLQPNIPTESTFYGYYGPDYTLNVRTSNMENKNDEKYLHQTLRYVTENFRNYVYPICTNITANEPPSETPEVARFLNDDDYDIDEHMDVPEGELYYEEVSNRNRG